MLRHGSCHATHSLIWFSAFNEVCACLTGTLQTNESAATWHEKRNLLSYFALCSRAPHICFQLSIPSWTLFQKWLLFFICTLSSRIVIVWKILTLRWMSVSLTELFLSVSINHFNEPRPRFRAAAWVRARGEKIDRRVYLHARFSLWCVWESSASYIYTVFLVFSQRFVYHLWSTIFGTAFLKALVSTKLW